MKFKDPEWERIYELNISSASYIDEIQERQVFALFGIVDWFRGIEGDDSLRLKEAIDHLLSTELRPALRSWYRRFGADMNPTAIQFREQLSLLAGERFGGGEAKRDPS